MIFEIQYTLELDGTIEVEAEKEEEAEEMFRHLDGDDLLAYADEVDPANPCTVIVDDVYEVEDD